MKNRVFIFLLFFVSGASLPSLSGLLIYPFSNIPSSLTTVYAIVLSLLFLFISVLLVRRGAHSYGQIFFAFFVAAIAIFLDLLVNLPSDTTNGLLLDMLVSTSIIVATILLLIRISGNSFSSIFLQKGNLKMGLAVGTAGFLFFALTSVPAAQYLFQGQNLSVNRVMTWLPWIIPIILMNGVREELLYRGLFLRKFQTKLGPKTSNLLQAIVFSLSHSVAGLGPNAYTPVIWILVAFTFSLGLAWGYIMQRTDSVIGPILFHAGTDIPVFLGVFSNTF